jgi:hypothetical protein
MATPKSKKKSKATRKTKTAPARAVAKKAAAPARAAAKKKAKKAAAKPAAPARKSKAAKVAKTTRPVAKAAKAAKKAKAKPIQRRDHPGHIDPKYAKNLLRKSDKPEKEPDSFIPRARSKDTLVEELGEEFVKQVTSAEYGAEDAMNQDVVEEVGGPFIETRAGTEFAEGTDASNPKGATREPFPRT